MTATQEDWVHTRTAWLDKQVQSYPETLRPLVEAPYVQGAMGKMPLLPKVQADFAGFQTRMEVLLSTLPAAEGVKANSFSNYLQALGDFKELTKEAYNLVPKGYYKRQYLFIGIALGICYGLLFKHMVVGLILGTMLGLAIGSGKDQKAEKENRVL